MYAGALLYGASLFGFVLTPPGGAPPPQLSPTPQLVLDLEGLEEPESSDEADLAEAIAEDRFLILPHPEVEQYEQNRANDRERWLGGMRKLQRHILSED